MLNFSPCNYYKEFHAASQIEAYHICIDVAMYNRLSQPKHSWCKNSCGQESKKGHGGKDVKSKWATKASCC